ncbi:MAG: NUDIX hydrolase [Anaerolineales bacterium]|jgi:8-oxo-dGTP pyrophosphatase MutT (NUDIX family)
MIEKWQTLNAETVFNFSKFNLKRYAFLLPNQQVAEDYYVLEEQDVGSVVAMTPDQNLVMVRQFKHGIQEICLELPAGLFEDENGDPVRESRRELLEETGYEAKEYIYLGSLAQNPTRLSNRVHIVLGVGAHRVSDQRLDPNEDIEVVLIPVDQIRAKIRSGEIHALGTVAGIFLALDYLQQEEI